jgi:hypothetical protein
MKISPRPLTVCTPTDRGEADALILSERVRSSITLRIPNREIPEIAANTQIIDTAHGLVSPEGAGNSFSSSVLHVVAPVVARQPWR